MRADVGTWRPAGVGLLSALRRQVRKAQYRLWLRRWLDCLGWSFTVAGGLVAAVTLADRIFALGLPFAPSAGLAAAAALLVGSGWFWRTRASAHTAAVALDQAALLKERVSSGLYCLGSQDPFAQAVHADAERLAAEITVPKHLPLRWPRSGGYAAGAVLAACLVALLPTWDVLGRRQARQHRQAQQRRLAQEKAAFEKKMARLKTVARSPVLNDLFDQLDKLDQLDPNKIRKPDDLKREALKRIERVRDLARQRRDETRFGSLEELKRMLRRLQVSSPSDTPLARLSSALARGDFQAARQALEQLQEKLAKMSGRTDPEQIRRMQARLAELAKQLRALSQDKQLAEQLRKAGLDDKKIARLMKNLSEQDLKRLADELKARGMSSEQIRKLLDRLRKRICAARIACNLGGALSGAAAALADMDAASLGEALAGLQAAGEQLDELAGIEQEMLALESALAELEALRRGQDGLGCGTCAGQGSCVGRGGMGRKPGQGRGGVAPEEATPTGFVKRKSPVKTGKGVILHSVFVNGIQLKGDVNPEYVEAVIAAEREAAEALSNDRLPRQYQTTVKKYFTKIQQDAVSHRGGAGN